MMMMMMMSVSDKNKVEWQKYRLNLKQLKVSFFSHKVKYFKTK